MLFLVFSEICTKMTHPFFVDSFNLFHWTEHRFCCCLTQFYSQKTNFHNKRYWCCFGIFVCWKSALRFLPFFSVFKVLSFSIFPPYFACFPSSIFSWHWLQTSVFTYLHLHFSLFLVHLILFDCVVYTKCTIEGKKSRLHASKIQPIEV